MSKMIHRCQARLRGIALIIVLASIALLTILIISFLASIGTELQSSKVYANGSSTRLLAESAVSMVIGQIQTATYDQTQCWASEPGMIRTYNNSSSASGDASGYYKLYSDSIMQGTGNFDHTATTNQVPSTWYNQTGVYVDLNQPVSVDGTNYYPIIDGNISDYTNSYTTSLSTLVTTTPSPSSSIYSLTSSGTTNGLPGVNGFWINSTAPIQNPTSPANIVPMPVKWLYVLQNGAVIAPDSATGTNNGIVTFNNATQTPSASNPIVGRMAFWTDDETCKVNINTAAEGTSWDTPRVISTQDYAYATSQPMQNEFQRYPGHPATVSISAVFNGLTADSGFPEDFYTNPTSPTKGIAPRTTAGGSEEGTQPVTQLAGDNALSLLSTRLYTDPDELMFQPALASGTPGTGLRSLNDNLLASTNELNPTAIQKARFFITANSEAPDVNVFNLPRISMWPITLTGTSAASLTQAMTAYDKLIAFCATIGGNIFYFQRWDPTSPTNDLPTSGGNYTQNPLNRNRDLIEYLRTLTSQNIPGFGGSFAAKYGTPGDRDQILAEMFDYIRATNLEDSSSGSTKYAPALDSNSTTTDPYSQGGLGQVVPIIDQNITVTDTVSNGATGSTLQSNPRGFGRFPTVQSATLVFIGAGDSNTQAPGTYPLLSGTNATLTAATDPNPPTSYTPPVTTGNQRVQAALFLQMFDPSQGVSLTRPYYEMQVSGLSNLYWGSSQIFPTNAASPFATSSTTSTNLQPTDDNIQNLALQAPEAASTYFAGYSYGGIIDFRQFNDLRGSTTAKYGLPVYPYISPPTGTSIGVNGGPDLTSGGTFSFTSKGDVTVQIYAVSTKTSSSSTLLQTIYLHFPNATFPVPTSIDNNIEITTSNPTNPITTFIPGTVPTGFSTSLYDFLSFIDNYPSTTYGDSYGRLDWSSAEPWLCANDVARAIVAAPGDMRLIAARQYVPDAFYQPISTPTNTQVTTATYNNYTNSGAAISGTNNAGTAPFLSHMLRWSNAQPFYGALGGAFLVASGFSYDDSSNQYISIGGAQLDTTFTLTTNTGERPADVDVPNQAATIATTNESASVTLGVGDIGDWDTGVANLRDGAYINKADEGDQGSLNGSGGYNTNGYPYFELAYSNQLPSATFFTPNRMIPSPGMFGSLPSQVFAGQSWQTLLFRPGPSTPVSHFGLGTPVNTPVSGIPAAPPYSATAGTAGPPDHLFMDLFNMPVVEPYAISSPLATAGRINMNYLIVPFTYINRDTGLRAVMKNQMMAVIANTMKSYKTHQNVAGGFTGSGNTASQANYISRYSINLDSTLSQFLARFYPVAVVPGTTVTPDIFHSASEICDIDLVPNDTTATGTKYLTLPIKRVNMDSYWAANALTGDNLRERPYTNIYPLLTTKSNTYTVHFRVQTLKQLTRTNPNPTEWREGTDVIVGEYRGSETIERYVDPNAATVNGVNFPDYATSINSTTFPPATPLSQFYKFHVVSTRQFAP